MAVLVMIRHADAGRRDRWQGDDRLRGLGKKGRRQAEALARTLADVDLRRILSSPYLRCVQTMEPLAEGRGLPVETTEDLAEGAGLERVLRLFRELSGMPAALCTHGDVTAELGDFLIERGLIQPDDFRNEKGGAWLLQEKGGELTAARYLPPRQA
jgi:phosphohistidine phosphatase SixA